MPNDIIGFLVDLCPLSVQQEVEDPCASDEGYPDNDDSEPTIG